MKPEEQRIAIAKACGWSRIGCEKNLPFHGWNEVGPLEEIPDYLNDLNAMHEAEKVLSTEQLNVYTENLVGIVIRDSFTKKESYCWFNATAAQRAEAFLRTLKFWTK